MKFVLHMLMIFLATLAIAALVALGEPDVGGGVRLPAADAQPAASR
ncbi:hypothetical protein ACPWT1_09915 [Ramlibacter sp. MMS24-I3-19]